MDTATNYPADAVQAALVQYVSRQPIAARREAQEGFVAGVKLALSGELPPALASDALRVGHKTLASIQIGRMRGEIAMHDRAYYDQGRPTVSDTEYDRLFAQLQAFESLYPDLAAPDSPTRRVGERVAAGGGAVQHITPMLSIANTYDLEGVKDFHDRTSTALAERGAEPPVYRLELKYDGLALKAVYENGHLTVAATRGDGEAGDDVTRNAPQIANLPARIASRQRVEIRGEVVLPKEAFARINARLAALGEAPYKSARNAAAGLLRKSDLREIGLMFLPYGLSSDTRPAEVATQKDALDRIVALGFSRAAESFEAVGVEQIVERLSHISALRDSLPFDIDGVVVKLDDLALSEALGSTSRTPRAQLAFKFNQQDAWTQVEDIDVQVGRTGALTPVARLAPVEIGGVTVTNATLHNAEEVARLDVRVGDWVRVLRAGDVIPDILEVDRSRRPEGSAPWAPPSECPCCQSPVSTEGATAYCSAGLGCDAARLESLIYFASRPCMDIQGMGDVLVRDLFRLGVVRDFEDIYRLGASSLARVDRMGAKSISNLLGAVEKSRDVRLERFITALGIRHCAQGTGKRLGAHFNGDVSRFLAATRDELEVVPDIGPTTAESIAVFLCSNRERIASLAACMRFEAPTEQVSEKLAGLTFVVTGAVAGFTRDSIKSHILSHGGKVTDSVSAKTSYLVCGEDAGNKLDKARKLGITVLSGDDLRTMTEACAPRP